MKNQQISLDSKDFLIILEMAFSGNGKVWTYQNMADGLGLSPSQVHASVGKLLVSGLLNGEGLKAKVNREALADFIVHGARYEFPPVKGAPCRGILTGASSKIFDPQQLVQEEDIPWVWPSARGEARGTSLAPIHPCVPEAILHDPNLHEALVYFDALRVGKVREREVAEAFFRGRLAWAS
jgi:DNA-binding Lrp family transcriptional regulator